MQATCKLLSLAQPGRPVCDGQKAYKHTDRSALGDVRRVTVFNDPLFEFRDRSHSDHGFVRALLRLRRPDPV